MNSTSRTRVAHIIHSLGAGGAEAVLTELAEPARAAGIDVVVVGLSDAEDDRAAVALQEAGVSVYQLHAGRDDPRSVAAVRRILVREGAQVVHTHLKHADIVGGLAARWAGLPAVSTLHVIEDTPADLLQRARVRAAVQARERLFRRVVVLSRAQRDWYLTVSPGASVELIPNGVGAPRPTVGRDGLREGLGVGPGGTLAVVVSLMRPEKGHADLLDAVRQLGGTDVTVALAGDGPLLGDIREQVVADPALTERVRVLGYRTDVDELLEAADIVVHPSSADALPTALIRALGSGRPVVATRVGGIPDIITEECGVLVPAGDTQALAEAIASLTSDPARRTRMGKAARRRYEAEFSASVWAARLAALYRDISGEGRWLA